MWSGLSETDLQGHLRAASPEFMSDNGSTVGETCPSTESFMISTVQRVNITFNDESIKIDLNPHEFKFEEFDAWIRSRFGLNKDDKIQYSDAFLKGYFYFVCIIITN